MKSRVPLAGYIAVILLYWVFIPFFLVTLPAPVGNPIVSNVFFSKFVLDTGLTIFLVAALAFSRMMFIGSDLENLLITGVSKWRLTRGIFLFIIAFVSPLILLFSRALLLLPLSFSVPYEFLISGTFMLYFIFIFTAILSIVLGFDRSFYFVFVVSMLNFSNLVGNPVSMGNIDSPLYTAGFLAFLAVLISVAAVLVVSISREGYAPYRLARKRKAELVRTPIDFSGSDPHKASKRLGYSLTLSSVANNTSVRGPRYARISTRRELLFLAALNIALAAALIYIFHTPIGATNGAIGDTVIIYGSVFTAMINWSMISMSLAQERIWLMGSTIGGRLFLRNHVLSKSLLFATLMLPSLIPPIGMAIMGHPLFLRLGLFFAGTLALLAFPASVLGLYISGFILPEQFVKNEMPFAGTLSLFVISIPMIFTLIAGLVSYFYIWFLPASAAAMYALAIIFLMNPGLHDRIFHSLVSRRFI